VKFKRRRDRIFVMDCDCFERVMRHDFTACSPEHQPVVDAVKTALEQTMRDAVQKAVTKLARGMIDDELVLSEDVIA
jgi:hypothetical protein